MDENAVEREGFLKCYRGTQNSASKKKKQTIQLTVDIILRSSINIYDSRKFSEVSTGVLNSHKLTRFLLFKSDKFEIIIRKISKDFGLQEFK